MKTFKLGIVGGAIAALLSAHGEVKAADSVSDPATGIQYSLGGYLRQDVSVNLQDHPETKPNDTLTLQMLRSQLRLDFSAQSDRVKLVSRVRAVEEEPTEYQNWLKNTNKLTSPYVTGAAQNPDSHGLYDYYNGVSLRELYLDLDAIQNRLSFRLGRQQIAWGETDFFAANDLVHGFDYSWRSFLEGDNEELRKPLIIGAATVQVPEARGNVQMFVRPGLDRSQDIGNTYDFWGGRWANQPNKGEDFLTGLTYNLDHPDGDHRKPTGGIRWSGIAGDVNYSASYLRTFNPNPVISPARFLGTPLSNVTPQNALGDIVYPFIDVAGATASVYSAPVDTVFSTEVAYRFNQPYNKGWNNDRTPTGATYGSLGLPGFGGVFKKDTVTAMVRGDHQLNLENIFFTRRPSFFSVQVFNTFIPTLSDADRGVEMAGFGAPLKKYDSMATGILVLNYLQDRLNVNFAGGANLVSGSGFLVPSIDLLYGDHLRFRLEADLFFTRPKSNFGQFEDKARLFDYFANNDQLLFRAQYLF
jgi:hypothetical protein